MRSPETIREGKWVPVSFSYLSYRNKKVFHSYLQSLVPGVLDLAAASSRLPPFLHWLTSDPSRCRGANRCSPSPSHPHPHCINFRRFREFRTGQAEGPAQRRVKFPPLGSKPQPLAPNTTEPQTDPSCQRPVCHLRQMSPRNITDQKTNPELASTVPSFFWPYLRKRQPS